MLNRQKVLIRMVRRAGRPVSPIELIKWAFLLRAEMPSGGGGAFYEFLPHRHGPDSFSLRRDARKLQDSGHLTRRSTRWVLPGSAVSDLPAAIGDDADRVVDRMADKRPAELLDYVYTRFPWYTANSRRRALAARPAGACAVHTAGYQGRQVEGFLDLLLRSGVRSVVDVRRNPVARRFGFHRSTLSRLCGAMGMDYRHEPALGIPSQRRRDLEGPDDYRRLFDWYRDEILPSAETEMERLGGEMRSRPTVLVCMEADPRMCHRTRVAEEVARRTGLSIRHLGTENETGV